MSKLNPQKAKAYVGPGVLRKGGKITKVPNGPLVKKKGQFKGSTLKNGGTTKTTTKQTTEPPEQRAENSRKVDSIISSRTKELKNPTPKNSNEYTNTPEFRKLFSESAERSNRAAKQAANSIPTKANGGLRKNGGIMKKAQNGEYITQEEQKWNGKNMRGYTATKKVNTKNGPRYYQSKSPDLDFARSTVDFKINANPADSIPKAKLSPRALEVMNQKNGGKVKKAKGGAMIKRADGSMSKRGLWDNLRSKAAQNKKTGAKPKSPTKAMLTQEKKIKAKGK